ncbi:MAG: M20/M25/M40 family metallo-hydrolase [Pseudomonadota bacterium]
MSGFTRADAPAPPTPAALQQQVTTLMRSPNVDQAFQYLEQTAGLTNRQMVVLNEIPAPPFGESARAETFRDMLLQAGLEQCVMDAAGNVIGRIKGRTGARQIALIAHLDTVFPVDTDVTVRIDGDRFAAPGIGDNARGLALMLAVARALQRASWTFEDDVLLIGSVGEEGLGDLSGVRHLFRPDAAPISSVIAVDGGAMTRIVTSAVGSNRYRVTFAGPGGHSYGSFGRANPHHALGDAISTFRQQAAEVVAEEGAKATFSVGRIGGGTSINSIAFESWMEVDMRSVDPDRLAALDAVLHRSIQAALERENAARTEGSALSVAVTSVGKRPAGQQDVRLPLIQSAIAVQRALGIEPSLVASSTDANVPIAAGIPAITVSRGGVSGNAHSLAEFWQDVDARKSEQQVLLLLALEATLIRGEVPGD